MGFWSGTDEGTSIRDVHKLLEAGKTKAAMDILLKLALNDDAEAAFLLGDISEFGKHNYEEAAKWYELAAKNGHAKAQWCLGNLYMVGNGVPLDQSKALLWYRRAAEEGVPEAQFVLGEFVRVGDFVKQNLESARFWYQQAQMNGYSPAGSRLQQMDEGKAVPAAGRVSPASTRPTVGLAAASEVQDSAVLEAAEEGLRLYKENRGPKDLAAAFGLLMTAAKGGHVGSQYAVAMMFFQGEGVSKDLAMALHWFVRAAEGGLAEAQHEASVMLFNGVGCKPDPEKAFYWCQHAASQGHVESTYNMGLFFMNGIAVKKDPRRAIEYVRKAAALGHTQAKTDLRTMGISST